MSESERPRGSAQRESDAPDSAPLETSDARDSEPVSEPPASDPEPSSPTQDVSQSDDDVCIRVASLGKRYYRKHLDAMLLRELLPGLKKHPGGDDAFWALRDVDFTVRAGETVAVLGHNGSGKSTLLGLLAGAIRPTEGRVSVRGRVAPILSLGVGFEADMSAVENAYLTASLLGIGEDEVTARLTEMLEFAALGEFVDTPVRHYSSGMLARLGFAVAMHVEREILLVDEVLAVGDQAFQAKCVDRVRALQAKGLTLFFVSHDFDLTAQICDRALWLDGGRLRGDGPVQDVMEQYRAAT